MACRRAHRDKQGNYDGESSDEDDERVAPPTVELRPVGDRSITVVATADLHRCHDDQYIHVGGSRYSLAEWFESAHSPPHVDLVLFAGDLGLDLNEQLCPTGRYKDRRAGYGESGPSHPLSVTPRANDKRTLLSFNALLRRICKAKPMAHIVICGGNHDGLICSDDTCLACHRKQVGRCEWGGCVDGHGKPIERCEWDGFGWPRLAVSTHAAAARSVLLDGIDQSRARVLHDSKWDIVMQSGVLVRVVGSPWTCYDSKNKQHITGSHHWRPRGGTIYGGDKLPLTGGRTIHDERNWEQWWRGHWAKIGAMLDGTATDFDLSILVTHTPPEGAGDLIDKSGYQKLFQNGEHVGDDKLTEMLRGLARPPRLHAFGHVHAKQAHDEPPAGPRLFAMRRRPGTLFANVAAERQLPVISALRLQRLANDLAQKVKVTAAKMQRVLGGGGGGSDEKLEEDQEELRLENYTEEEIAATRPVGDSAAEPIMRPPTVVALPLDGWSCAEERWEGWAQVGA